MRKEELINALTRTFYKSKLMLKKHSPEILLVTGVAGIVTSAVMACKATTKLNDIVEDAKESIDIIREGAETGTIHGETCTKEECDKALAITYAHTGLKFAKLYGPALTLGGASIICIFASNNIMRKRNVALAAAYATVDQGFKEYRGRLIDRFGKELDRELKYNIKAETVNEIVTDENGKEKVVEKTVYTADPNLHSDYARFFDDTCIGWERSSERNLFFLKQAESFANRKLREQGYLFLNDVYEMLGIPKTAAGQVVGWYYDLNHPVGDNFVDFGIYDLDDERKRAFVNGHEYSILLEFNVDGNILEYI